MSLATCAYRTPCTCRRARAAYPALPSRSTVCSHGEVVCACVRSCRDAFLDSPVARECCALGVDCQTYYQSCVLDGVNSGNPSFLLPLYHAFLVDCVNHQPVQFDTPRSLPTELRARFGSGGGGGRGRGRGEGEGRLTELAAGELLRLLGDTGAAGTSCLSVLACVAGFLR